jgi:hypothetical protein
VPGGFPGDVLRPRVVWRFESVWHRCPIREQWRTNLGIKSADQKAFGYSPDPVRLRELLGLCTLLCGDRLVKRISQVRPMDLDLQIALRNLNRDDIPLFAAEAIPRLPKSQLPLVLEAVLEALPDDELDRVSVAAAREQLRRRHATECSGCAHRRDMHESGPPQRCFVAKCPCREAWPSEQADWSLPF